MNIVVALNDSRPIILFITGGGPVLHLDGGHVSLGEWHDLLLEMSDSDNG